jgi:hypothetical protein
VLTRLPVLPVRPLLFLLALGLFAVGCDAAGPSASPGPDAGAGTLSGRVAPAVVYTVMGSSNPITAYCSATQSPMPRPGRAYVWVGGASPFRPYLSCADAEYGAGTMWAGFAHAYGLARGVGSLYFVPTARRGATLLPTDAGANWWLPASGGALYAEALAETEAALAAAAALGRPYRFGGWLWQQGNDQAQIVAGQRTMEEYEAGFAVLLDSLQARYPEATFWHLTSFTDVNGDSETARAFRAMERAACEAHPYCEPASPDAPPEEDETAYTVAEYHRCQTGACRESWFHDDEIHWGWRGHDRIGGTAGTLVALASR